MTNTQVTLAQIDNYGPWTVTPNPRKEVDLQTLQSRLYADLSQLVGMHGGYVFFTRFDNMVAITNGLDLEDHARIQESIGNRYPVTLSFGIGTSTSPRDALVDATALLQEAGSAQDAERAEVLAGQTTEPTPAEDDDVHLAHFDVNDATGEYTDELDAYSTFIHIEQAYASLMRYLHDAHDGLAFFVGGDNVIAVVPDLERAAYEDAIRHVREDVDMDLKVGVGSGVTAQDAGMAAKHALEICREDGTHVEGL
ncbi:GTP cyclohydrolase III [Halocalculus aciditolerans]|uniref:GTP cyclohydrolase III n=1 Tax=Halocalculus aciditolerans TaxID=1383812 RepID=A0A830FLM3_9EURY|nr:GTP cyclohydrolase III [Halocalculus aciditolerans]GGL58455.1 GTP cyclohydrolase IIa [Halocalculus aciditolerans]